jgi:hypothetical protein
MAGLPRPDADVRVWPDEELLDELDEELLDELDEEERRRSFSSSLPLSLSLPSFESLPLSVSSSDPSWLRLTDEAASQMGSPPALELKCALILSTYSWMSSLYSSSRLSAGTTSQMRELPGGNWERAQCVWVGGGGDDVGSGRLGEGTDKNLHETVD